MYNVDREHVKIFIMNLPFGNKIIHEYLKFLCCLTSAYFIGDSAFFASYHQNSIIFCDSFSQSK